MFGFNKVEHKDYQKNFLKSVVFQVNFKKSGKFQECKMEIEGLFKEAFPRRNDVMGVGFTFSFGSDSQTPIVKKLDDEVGISLKSEDGASVLSITNQSLSLTINGNGYSNYAALKKQLSKMTDFFKLCQISKIQRIAIRKINIIEFAQAENPIDLLHFLINDELLGNRNYFPDNSSVLQNIQSLIFQDSSFTLNLKYGLNILKNEEKTGQIIIDIDLFNTEECNTDSLYSVSDKINSEIFNVFHWVSSKKAINLLNG